MANQTLLRWDALRRLGDANVDESELEYARGRYFDADCPASVAVGDWVYVTGSAVSGVYQVAKADPTDAAKAPAVGVVRSKASSTRCLVHAGPGLVPRSVLSGSALTPFAVYYLGADGRIAAAPPAAASVVQPLGVAVDDEAFLLRPDHSFALPGATVAVAYAATINASPVGARIIDVPLTGNVATFNLAGGYDGQRLTVRIRQDATGGRTLAWGSMFRVAAGDATPGPSGAAGSMTRVGLEYDAVDGKWDFLVAKGGYA